MNFFLILLRTIHIFAGVFWVGAVLINFVFIAPAVLSTMPESRKFMQKLMVQGRFPIAMNAASWLTILAGLFLYLRDSGGLQLRWITSPVGLGFTLGAAAALASFLLGMIVLRPTARRMGAVGATNGSEDGPLSPKQQTEMVRLNTRMNAAGRINLILLAISLFCMATARYWVF